MITAGNLVARVALASFGVCSDRINYAVRPFTLMGDAPMLRAFGLMAICLITDAPTGRILPTKDLAGRLVAALAASIMDDDVGRLAVEMDARIPLDLLLRINDYSDLIMVEVCLNASTRDAPMLVDYDISDVILRPKDLRMIRRDLYTARCSTAALTMIIVRSLLKVVIFALLCYRAYRRADLIITLCYP